MAPPLSSQPNMRLNLSAGLGSAAVATLLVAVKIWAFAQTGALSIAASLADSALDLMISLVALGALIYAAKPADEDHAFGHSSAEDLAALAQSVFVMISAAVIAISAVQRLMSPDPEPLRAEGAGMAVMFFSVAVTLGLVVWQGRVARKTGSRVIAADRLHYVGDLLPNIGAIVALWASSRWNLGAIDNVVALAAAVVLAFGSLRIGSGAWDALMDRRADPTIVQGIAEIAAKWPGVYGFHDLKTRTAGSVVFVNLHIELDGAQTLRAAHDIGAGLRRAIVNAYPQSDVIIHKDVYTPPKS